MSDDHASLAALATAQVARVAGSESAVVEVPGLVLASPALVAALRASHWFVARLDRAPVVDKATLLHALYQSGKYPAGFGFNWDALLDALRDLEWLEPAAGIAFVWHAPDVLEARAPEVYATFLDVVADAQAHRAARGYALLRVLVPAGRPE